MAKVKNKSRCGDTEKSKLQNNLSTFRFRFKSYRFESIKKLDEMTTSYHESQTRFDQCEKKLVPYSVKPAIIFTFT